MLFHFLKRARRVRNRPQQRSHPLAGSGNSRDFGCFVRCRLLTRFYDALPFHLGRCCSRAPFSLASVRNGLSFCFASVCNCLLGRFDSGLKVIHAGSCRRDPTIRRRDSTIRRRDSTIRRPDGALVPGLRSVRAAGRRPSVLLDFLLNHVAVAAAPHPAVGPVPSSQSRGRSPNSWLRTDGAS